MGATCSARAVSWRSIKRQLPEWTTHGEEFWTRSAFPRAHGRCCSIYSRTLLQSRDDYCGPGCSRCFISSWQRRRLALRRHQQTVRHSHLAPLAQRLTALGVRWSSGRAASGSKPRVGWAVDFERSGVTTPPKAGTSSRRERPGLSRSSRAPRAPARRQAQCARSTARFAVLRCGSIAGGRDSSGVRGTTGFSFATNFHLREAGGESRRWARQHGGSVASYTPTASRTHWANRRFTPLSSRHEGCLAEVDGAPCSSNAFWCGKTARRFGRGVIGFGPRQDRPTRESRWPVTSCSYRSPAADGAPSRPALWPRTRSPPFGPRPSRCPKGRCAECSPLTGGSALASSFVRDEQPPESPRGRAKPAAHPRLSHEPAMRRRQPSARRSERRGPPFLLINSHRLPTCAEEPAPSARSSAIW